MTPNKWGYVVGARLIPNRLHARVLRHVKPNIQESDVFPTFYKLNTLRELRRYFPITQFEHFSYRFSAGPSYHANKVLIAATIDIATKLAPNYFAQTLHVFIRKR